MYTDWIVLFSSSFITIIGVMALKPRNRMREALVVFMFGQLTTWILGLLVVEFHLIQYPVRLFPHATQSSFTFEYFIYPAISIIFVLRFPENRPIYQKIGWYLLFPTWMTVAENIIEQKTNLIHYVHWNWFLTWITLLGIFMLSRIYYLWFFKKSS